MRDSFLFLEEKLEDTMIARDASATGTHLEHSKFSALLFALLLLFLLHPFFPGVGVRRVLLPLLFSAVLISALYALRDRRVPYIVGLVLIVPALLASWAALLSPSAVLVVSGRLLMMSFLVMTCGTILRYVLEERRVTVDTLAGAAAVYLLIGLVFAFVFWSFEMIRPESFELLTVVNRSDIAAADLVLFPQLAYFSLVTLTTLGYGDIAPLSEPARAFAALEAVFGQFFLAILVARLVGILGGGGGNRGMP